MPELGAIRELRRRSALLRMWPIPEFPNHLSSTDASVEIVHVLHAARDIPTILEQEPS
jgi:hypothetical protein